MSKKFIIDTNVLLSDPYAFLKFDNNGVIIPLTVLEELDKQKSSDRDIARDARAVVRALDNVIGDKDEVSSEGVLLDNGGRLRVAAYDDSFTTSLDVSCNDDKIISIALQEQMFSSEEVVLVSNDLCMRLKAKGCGLHHAQEFSSDIVVEDADLLPKGYCIVPDGWLNTLPSEDVISKSCGETWIKKVHIEDVCKDDAFGINDWLINEDEKVAARFDSVEDEYYVFTFHNVDSQLMSRKCAGISPKSIYQAIAFDALLDPEIPIVFIDGQAGSGKSLISLASSIEMVKGKKSYRMEEIYFSRTLKHTDEEVGFLPGNEAMKLSSWMGACTDNLDVIARQSKNAKYKPENAVDMTDGENEDAFIKYKALTFMRGRSINFKCFFLDESQNLTAAQMKTYLSRVGQNCKCIVLGNLSQIDSEYLSPRTSGLTYAMEKFHGSPLAKVIRLEGNQRSEVAEFVEENF